MNRPEASILLVDDVPDNLQVLSEILIREGHRVRPVTNGEAALRTIEAELPHLVLTDIKMPGMDGFELCRRLKADPRTCEIPVMFISALGETKDKVRAFEMGGVDYVTKPFQAGEVAARVRTQLAVHQLRLSLQEANRALEERVQRRTRELTANLESLQSIRATLNLVLDTVPHSVFWKDTEGRYLGCNRVFSEVAGLDGPASIVGKTDFDLGWAPGDAQAYRADDIEVLSRNRPKLHIVEQVRLAGREPRWISTSKAPLRGKEGVPFALLGVFEDITERRRAEKAKAALLQISEAAQTVPSLKALFEHIHEIVSGLFVATNFYIAVFDERTGYLSFPYFVDESDLPPPPRKASNSLTDLVVRTGRPHLLTRGAIVTLMQEGAVGVMGTLPECWLGVPLLGAQGTFGAVVLQSYGDAGSYREADIEIFQFVATQIAACIQRKQAEEDAGKVQAQLHQSQKMESLGSLAGGVAHDMNNVLAAILALSSAHLQIQPEESSAHKAFETIAEAATRGGKMVKSLLNFARQSPAEKSEVNLNSVLFDEIHLLEHTVLADVRIELDLAQDLHPVHGDASALTHALMNLCVNAVDAMPQGGTLFFQTRNQGADHVEVVVRDSGCGMTPEVMAKAFDPFYTTKEVGKGTGLGLSLVFSTVKAHHGEIELQSEPGRGTEVLLRFPRAQALEAGAVQEVPQPPSGANLNLLLVDDDDLVLKSMGLLVEVLGHTATRASSGEEALALMDRGYLPDAVILDMNMPGLGGQETLRRLRAKHAELPVFLATGRADQEALHLVGAHPHVTLLPKPFDLDVLKEHLLALGRG
jgi:PAS domain S-box-containing protein